MHSAKSKRPVRVNLAQRHATPIDLDRISYTISLMAFNLGVSGLPALSKLGRRWLAWYAALNRCGEVGYIGVTAPIPAITRSEFRANGQTSSDRTTHRAHAELVAKGYLTKATPRLGSWRQFGPEEGFGARDIVCVYTLTAAALSIWQVPKFKKPALHVVNDTDLHKPTTANLAEVRSLECFKNPHSSGFLQQPHAPEDIKPIIDLESPNFQKVSPTAIFDSGLSPAKDSHEGKKQKNIGSRIEIARSSGKKSKPATKKERQNLLLFTLSTLAKAQNNTTAAKFVIARAALEIAAPQLAQTGIDWEWWLSKWPDYDRPTREYIARREIWPLLAKIDPVPAAASAPASKKIDPAVVTAAAAAAVGAELDKAQKRLDERVKLGECTAADAAALLNLQKRLLWDRHNRG